MLIDVVDKLEQDIRKLLYDAYMTQFNSNALEEARSGDGASQSSYNNKANLFADTAAPAVKKAIHDFVKEIGITINIAPSLIAPPLPPALPGGPCGGVIPSNSVTVQ